MKFFATTFLLGLIFTSVFSQSTKQKPANPKPKAAAEKPKPTAKPTASTTKKTNEKDEWEKANAVVDLNARIAAMKKFAAAFPKSTRISEAYTSISIAEAVLGNEKLASGNSEAAFKLIKASLKDAPTPIPDQLFTDTLSKFPANLYFRGLRDEGMQIAKILESKAAANASQLLSIANFYLSVENGSEARRVAESVIKIDPNSSAAYQTRGLANRMDFRIEESAADYAKALELEPDSLAARRGLAEMKRSLGLADEAISLYREILVKDDANLPARAGLILALFDANKRADAEAEMTKSLEANPGNVILLAGAAYWYAAHNEGAKAVTYAQKAIESDPRFIWSHIALARGLLNQNKFADAEKALLAARKYGNFPTLEYEIASVKLSAGLYREAAEELAKSFSIKDGVIKVELGGRVPSEAKNFTDLIAGERKASLFTPTAADSADTAAQLKALLEFEQNLRSSEPNANLASGSADDFIRGDDKMKVHRQIFAASELLEKKVALTKVGDIAKDASLNLEAGLDVADAATAVMAGELYENRAIAAASGQYVNVPDVPRAVLSSVLRGRIEEINGWAAFQMDNAAEAVVHLKRAIGVLPANSVWWRSSAWRLGNVLVVSGNDAEALEAYIKSYKSSLPDAIRYNAIEAVYKRLHGNTLGLEERIGPNPFQPPVETVAQKVEPTPEASPIVPVMAEKTPVEFSSASPLAAPTETTKTEAEDSPTPQPTSNNEKPTVVQKDLFPPIVITIPGVETSKAAAKVEPTGEPSPSPTTERNADDLPTAKATPQSTPDIKPCSLIVDVENITLKNSVGVLAVIVRSEEDVSLGDLKVASSNPEDVTVKRELIDGLKAQALFIVRSVSSKTGDNKVTFEMPCGKKEINVKVQ